MADDAATTEYNQHLLQELGLQSVVYQKLLQSRLDSQAAETLEAYHSALAVAASEHKRVQEHALRDLRLLHQELRHEKAIEELYQETAREQALQRELEAELIIRRTEAERKRQDAAANTALLKHRIEVETAPPSTQVLAAPCRTFDERISHRQDAQVSTPKPRSSPVQIVTNRTEDGLEQPLKTISQPAQPIDIARESQTTTSHDKYVTLHKLLKSMRKDVSSMTRDNPSLKKQLGESRRQIRKSVGQLTQDSKANLQPLRAIKQVLFQARVSTDAPMLDATTFVISQPIPETGAADTSVPAPFIYLLNIFAKAVVSQFISEASVAPQTADPIGIVAITVFANNDMRWHEISLIDILLAKLHVVCPILFGTVNGDEKTVAGRTALGWWKDPETGTWVSEQRHAERMLGLAGGFAALTLRNFRKSASVNPLPARIYWATIARLVNLAKRDMTQTHLLVLRALIECHVEKFIAFYGHAAVCVLHIALVDVPEKVASSMASIALAALRQTIKRDHHLFL